MTKKISIRDKIITSHHYLEDLSGEIDIKLNNETIWFQDHDGLINQLDNLEDKIIETELQLANYKYALSLLKRKFDTLDQNIDGTWKIIK